MTKEQEELTAFWGRARLVLTLLSDWTHQHGESLCPGQHPDTYGTGMREAKRQVAQILGRIHP